MAHELANAPAEADQSREKDEDRWDHATEGRADVCDYCVDVGGSSSRRVLCVSHSDSEDIINH